MHWSWNLSYRSTSAPSSAIARIASAFSLAKTTSFLAFEQFGDIGPRGRSIAPTAQR